MFRNTTTVGPRSPKVRTKQNRSPPPPSNRPLLSQEYPFTSWNRSISYIKPQYRGPRIDSGKSFANQNKHPAE